MPEPPAIVLADPRRLRAEVVVVAACEGEPPAADRLPAELAAAARRLAARRGWRGADGQTATADPPAPGAPALALRGLGKRRELDARALRRWLEAAAEAARADGVRRLAVALPDHAAARGAAAAERVGRALRLAGYRFERFLSEPRRGRLERVEILPPAGEDAAYRGGLATASAVADAVAYERDLANTPPNEATPAWMAARAQELGKSHGYRVRVLGRRELAQRGMGGLLAVGGGSAHEPRLVRLEGGRGRRTVALVGKGVTFDTGGISIKPAATMDEMKYDKSGACTVLGVLRAAADLELPVRLRAYLPLAENMPDGTAYRPGDIVRCYNGKTVEILNTDAEGRMILADALAWAAEEKPEALLEFSTLTGACVVALGTRAGGLYTPDDAFAAALLAAAEEAGERLWRMPLWPEFVEDMKGHHADLRNAGPRWGSANTAAAFLSQFVDGLPRWAHLDIAGPAYVGSDGTGVKGATGYGIATVVRWLRAT